jgi:glycosyltransferase involved in cell wall biosynthesis
MPVISIVIPVYNRQHLIGRALTSLQRQTFTDFEVIVVDDGSRDDPGSVVRSMNDPRMRYVRQQNAGATVARNRGAAEASAKYLTFLDSDDEAQPEWLSKMLGALERTGAEAVSCGVETVEDGPGAEVTFKDIRLPREFGPIFPNQTGMFTNGGSFVLLHERFAEIGGYDPLLRSGQHTELAFRLVPAILERGGTITAVMEPLIRVHVHAGPRIRGNPAMIYAGSSRTLDKHKALFARDPKYFANYHAVAGVNAAYLGELKAARHHLLQALRIDPRRAEHWVRAVIALVPALMRRRWAGRTTPARRADLTHVAG